MYANTNFKHDGKLYRRGEEVDVKALGDQAKSLEESGTIVRKAPDTSKDSGSVLAAGDAVQTMRKAEATAGQPDGQGIGSRQQEAEADQEADRRASGLKPNPMDDRKGEYDNEDRKPGGDAAEGGAKASRAPGRK
jgi:hypothetical protein